VTLPHQNPHKENESQRHQSDEVMMSHCFGNLFLLFYCKEILKGGDEIGEAFLTPVSLDILNESSIGRYWQLQSPALNCPTLHSAFYFA
jgi:hypothetical protein